jgi:hypothetical protein
MTANRPIVFNTNLSTATPSRKAASPVAAGSLLRRRPNIATARELVHARLNECAPFENWEVIFRPPLSFWNPYGRCATCCGPPSLARRASMRAARPEPGTAPPPPMFRANGADRWAATFLGKLQPGLPQGVATGCFRLKAATRHHGAAAGGAFAKLPIGRPRRSSWSGVRSSGSRTQGAYAPRSPGLIRLLRI